jgi:hypothetical protein
MSATGKSPNELATEAVTTLFRPGDVVELRILGTRHMKKIGGALAAGYFNNLADLARNIVACSDNKRTDGYAVEACYVTLNPVQPALLARYEPNKMRKDAQITTADKEIVCRRYLLIDCDPQRPTGISSSDEEKAKAAVAVQQIKEHLTSRGWPLPIECDSGNGYHLLYRIDLPNDDESKELVRRCLMSLASRFDTPDVVVDKSVFNSSRITKAYSSLAKKGADAPQIGRPHRRSKMLTAPAEIQTVSIDLLQALAAEAPVSAPTVTGHSDLVVIPPEIFEAQLDAVGITHSGVNAYDGGFAATTRARGLGGKSSEQKSNADQARKCGSAKPIAPENCQTTWCIYGSNLTHRRGQHSTLKETSTMMLHALRLF